MGLTWVSRIVDRRLLADLEKPVWDSVATALQARLSDSAIERAVRALPPEQYQRDGSWMTRTLKARRDGLHTQADRFYHLLAWQVDLYATDKSEVAEIERHDDGSVTVRLSRRERRNGRADPPYYQRTFRPGETAEVRLYLHGGADQGVAPGRAPGGHPAPFLSPAPGTGARGLSPPPAPVLHPPPRGCLRPPPTHPLGWARARPA